MKKAPNQAPTEPSPLTPSVRGADDVMMAARLGQAIRDAMGDEMSQGDLARATGIDQPTLSKLIRGVRVTPLTVWEMSTIERATGTSHGFILQRAGYLPEERGVRESILSQPGLPRVARTMLLAAYTAAQADAIATEDAGSMADAIAAAVLEKLGGRA